MIRQRFKTNRNLLHSQRVMTTYFRRKTEFMRLLADAKWIIKLKRS